MYCSTTKSHWFIFLQVFILLFSPLFSHCSYPSQGHCQNFDCSSSLSTISASVQASLSPVCKSNPVIPMLKTLPGIPSATGQSLTSLGWQTRPFRSWPSSFLMRLVPASSFSGREVADCAWFSQVSGLGPCSETAPSSFMRFTAPHLWPPHPTVFLSWDLSGYSSPGQLFSFVVQQRLLSGGCKVPKAKD